MSPSWARICAPGIGGYYRRIGVAFEAPNHYLKLTARENLQLFAGLHGGGTEDPDGLLERVGLEQDGDKLVAEFSKGMRGRLTFARALLHRPQLLFLDEPTAGLDPVTARRIRQVIREARRGWCHRVPDDARHGDGQ